MDRRMLQDLDRHITGNYGEDSVEDDGTVDATYEGDGTDEDDDLGDDFDDELWDEEETEDPDDEEESEVYDDDDEED